MKKIFSSTQFLTNGVILIGCILMLFGVWVLGQIFGADIPEKHGYFLFALVTLFYLVGCWFMIRRREVPRPGLSSIKGSTAVIIGVVGLIVSSLAEIFFLYQLLVIH